MSVIVKSIEKMFRAMSDVERLATVDMISTVCKELGDTGFTEAEKSAPKKTAWKKRARGASAKSYWMRSVKGLDKTKKGMFQIEGDWVNNVAKDCEYGEKVVLGIKGDEKKYHLITRATAGSFSFNDSNGNLVNLENCESLFDSEKFGAVLSEIERGL
jgi:hypothetical protein